MTVTTNTLDIPEGLILADADAFRAKVAEFTTDGAAGIYAVFDFDRTLTVKRPGTQDEVTTWHILREHLTEKGQARYQELFYKYRALELSGDMTQQNAVDWWSGILNLFVEYQVDLAAVEETFLERANIRPGTAELFELLTNGNIPTVILSAGIRQVIDMWCGKYGIKPSLVISTSLNLDDKNRIIGWQEDTLVHALNKSEAGHPGLLAIRNGRTKALLVGDGFDDADMAAGRQDVIRARILDSRGDESVSESEEQRTFTRFDAVIKCGSLEPLCELVKLVI